LEQNTFAERTFEIRMKGMGSSFTTLSTDPVGRDAHPTLFLIQSTHVLQAAVTAEDHGTDVP
jgi:hypothetical protein